MLCIFVYISRIRLHVRHYAMLYLVLLILTCWKKKVSVKALRLEGFNCFTCPRPKCNKKAKRNSGGVCVYYKEKFFGNITLEKLNDKGIIWIKLNKSFLGYENDIYLYVAVTFRPRTRQYINNRIPLYLIMTFLNNYRPIHDTKVNLARSLLPVI